jgi:hypothetical protein
MEDVERKNRRNRIGKAVLVITHQAPIWTKSNSRPTHWRLIRDHMCKYQTNIAIATFPLFFFFLQSVRAAHKPQQLRLGKVCSNRIGKSGFNYYSSCPQYE